LKLLANYFNELTTAAEQGWRSFWFTPTDTATLGLIRILAGSMLFYTHLVWTLDLQAFFGPQPWLTTEAVHGFYGDGGWAWSYLNQIHDPTLLWTAHIAALCVFAMLALGLFSRVTSVLAYVIAASYANRVPGALFGLDQINVMLAMYLMIGPSGQSYSLDRLRASRLASTGRAPTRPSVSANVAIRLIQCHMCVIYLFAGLSKLSGQSWWDGSAMWLSLANLEYQSIDMTWMAGWPRLLSLMTHVSVMWEVSYCVLVWPRLTRPIVVALAIPLHLGIAFCLGMMTFGLVMLIGNLAFVSPQLVRWFVAWLTRRPQALPTVEVETATPAVRGGRRKPTTIAGSRR
jgi:hypothetical protein